MENGCGGRSLSLSFRMDSTTDGSRIPRLAEFARIKTNSFGLITPKAGRSIRLSQSKVVGGRDRDRTGDLLIANEEKSEIRHGAAIT